MPWYRAAQASSSASNSKGIRSSASGSSQLPEKPPSSVANNENSLEGMPTIDSQDASTPHMTSAAVPPPEEVVPPPPAPSPAALPSRAPIVPSWHLHAQTTPEWSGQVELSTPIDAILQAAEGSEGGPTPGSHSSASPGAHSRADAGAPGDTMLNDLAALLIDPAAKASVESIPLRTFVSMQPKRQLMALNNQQAWWEWIVCSTPYKEALQKIASTDSAGGVIRQDRRVLQEGGLTTLQHWVEQQHHVSVSPRTRSILDAAVSSTVQQHISQVLNVLGACHTHRHLLRQWLSDVVGKFILDSLKLSVETAAVSVQKARGVSWSSRRRRLLRTSPASLTAEENDLVDYDEAVDSDEDAMTSIFRSQMEKSKPPSAVPSSGKESADRQPLSSPPLRPGEVCTVEHYLLFLQKVTDSVRQERWHARGAGRAPGAASPAGLSSPFLYGDESQQKSSGLAPPDSQEEWEVQERTKAVVAAAFAHLLQHAVQVYLPEELRELAEGGYIALERVSPLLQRAAAQLQLRSLPVGHFIVHSVAQDPLDEAGGMADSTKEDTVGQSLPGYAGEPLRSSPPPAGAFLTDDEDPSIPLAQWRRPQRAGRSAQPRRALEATGNPVQQVRASLYDGESLQETYYSMLYHLQSSLDKLAYTTLEELFDDADSLSGCPRSATVGAGSSYLLNPICPHPLPNGGSSSSSSIVSGIFGDDPLFGTAKLVEDRLSTAMSVSPAASAVGRSPLFFVEAGESGGKTALLERLQQRLRPEEIDVPQVATGLLGGAPPSSSPATTRGGAVIVRYASGTMPFIPDLDDHPVAFAARFWFRVALSSMPFFTRSELLFSRAPTSSPLWWSSQHQSKHWSFNTLVESRALPRNCIPSCVLVDDIHCVLDAMENKWGRVLYNVRGEPVPSDRVRRAFQVAMDIEKEQEAVGSDSPTDASAASTEDPKKARLQQLMAELSHLLDNTQNLLDLPVLPTESAGDDAEGRGASGALALPHGSSARLSSVLLSATRRNQVAEELQRRTGQSMVELLSNCMAQFTAAQREVHMALAGQRLSPLLLAYTSGGAGCVVRPFHLPLLRPGALSWQQRLRVLPPLAVLQALHRHAGIEMSGVLYEVIKNSPGLIGSAIEMLWSTSASTAAASAAPMSGGGGGSGPSHSVVPYEAPNLFLELPLRNRLLFNPQQALLRLVELLQRQLCSPSGYLTTSVDTTPSDIQAGLITQHHHTLAQVHPFAMFIIFSFHQVLDHQQEQQQLATHSHDASLGEARKSVHLPLHKTPASRDRMQELVQGWKMVWAEYCETTRFMATTPTRKKDALRVLLYGALKLRFSTALELEGASGAPTKQIPPFGFPLLASDVRLRPGRRYPTSVTSSFSAYRRHEDDPSAMEVKPATREIVQRAMAAYRNFFAHASLSASPMVLRPSVGLNAGCEVVVLHGSTLCLYDIAISSHQLSQTIQRRYAEALLGVLHVLATRVLPEGKIRQVQYVTVVCCDQEEEPMYYRQSTSSQGPGTELLLSRRPYSTTSGFRAGSASNDSGMSTSSFGLQRPDNVAAAVPYSLDYSAMLDDDTMDVIQYLRREVLDLNQTSELVSSGEGSDQNNGSGVSIETIRTISDLLDALQQNFGIAVTQRVLSTFDELEGLLSPTLLQLVPDSMLLPPFSPAVVSSEELLRDILQQERKETDAHAGLLSPDDIVESGAQLQGRVEPVREELWAGASQQEMDDTLSNDVEMYESTEMLEAMLNDEFLIDPDDEEFPTDGDVAPSSPPSVESSTYETAVPQQKTGSLDWLNQAMPASLPANNGMEPVTGSDLRGYPPVYASSEAPVHPTVRYASPSSTMESEGARSVKNPSQQHHSKLLVDSEELEESEEAEYPEEAHAEVKQGHPRASNEAAATAVKPSSREKRARKKSTRGKKMQARRTTKAASASGRSSSSRRTATKLVRYSEDAESLERYLAEERGGKDGSRRGDRVSKKNSNSTKTSKRQKNTVSSTPSKERARKNTDVKKASPHRSRGRSKRS